MPKGSKYKYEVDKNTGRLVLDRPVKLKVPANYGFIPHTLSEDGDAMDLFIICKEPIPPLAQVKVKIIAALKCKDKGIEDNKIIGVIYKDEEFEKDPIALDSIIHYLRNYKTKFIVQTLCPRKEALKLLEQAKAAYLTRKEENE